jgi:FixJ family two-component response regulator
VPKESLISIVDDDESVREAIKGLIRSLGYAVESFTSAQGFIASKHLRRTACLIADVNMPVMTGAELHRHLVASKIHIPTILITAYPDDQAKQRALRAGVICYLSKPFDETALLDCIQSAVGAARPGG